MNTILSTFNGVLASMLQVWGLVWWIVLPIVTAVIFWEYWLYYIRVKFIKNIRWKLLEIKVPKNVLKTPKAMEQIFAAAHTPYSYGLRFFEKYWEGVVEYWMSFEIMGRAGASHFYLRLPSQYRNLMESAIFAQYPDAEITEIPEEEDYVKQMPKVIPNKEFDVFGYEQILRNPDYYPIRTYPMFEESVEERRIDTIGPLIEGISKLKADEQIWLQIMVRPTSDEWKKPGEEKIKQMLGIESKEKKGPGIFSGFGLGISLGEVLFSPFKHPDLEAKPKRDETRTNTMRMIVSPGEKEITEAIHMKLSKLAFETTIRFLYIDRKDAFTRDNVNSVTGFFRQFNTMHMNMFRPDKATMTGAVYAPFKQKKLAWRKRLLYERYYYRTSFNEHKPILNIEELATIYHFPITAISTTELEKVESRKGTPPAALPTVEE